MPSATQTIPDTVEHRRNGSTTRRKVPSEGAPFNEVERVILERRSVRLYRSKQVPEYLLRRVLEAGRYAPSAGNTQPWRFVVVRDPETLADMEAFVRGRLTLATKYLDYTKPDNKASRWVTERLMRLRPGELHPTPLTAFGMIGEGKLGVWHGAPTVIFMEYDTRGAGAPLIDVGISGQNMVLAAHSMGLGTCWVSFAKLLETSRRYKKLLQLEHPYRLATSIALGFPRGLPDGMVTRETQQSLWIEAGGQAHTVT